MQAKLETKALKAKRPGFTDDRYSETSYYVENGRLTSLLLGTRDGKLSGSVGDDGIWIQFISWCSTYPECRYFISF